MKGESSTLFQQANHNVPSRVWSESNPSMSNCMIVQDLKKGHNNHSLQDIRDCKGISKLPLIQLNSYGKIACIKDTLKTLFVHQGLLIEDRESTSHSAKFIR